MKCCQRDDCNKQLVRKPDETAWNFKSRIYCDKRCASIVSNRRRIGICKPRLHKLTQAIEITASEALTRGISYTPGSPEFKKLAEMYQK